MSALNLSVCWEVLIKRSASIILMIIIFNIYFRDYSIDFLYCLKYIIYSKVFNFNTKELEIMKKSIIESTMT